MIASEQFKPLLEVGMQYVIDIAPHMSNKDVRIIKDVLSSFIEGRINFSMAAGQFRKVIGTQAPLDKINSILVIVNNPFLPKFEKNSNIDLDSSPQHRKKTCSWSKLEDQRLLAAIHIYGLENWSSVSEFVGNSRTRAQCAQRWSRGLDPRISKVVWTEEEEEKLINCVYKYGNKSWTKIASILGNRSDAQCRYHYNLIKADPNKKERKAKLVADYSVIKSNIMERAVQPVQITSEVSTIPNIQPSAVKIPSIYNFIEEMDDLPAHMKISMQPFTIDFWRK